MWRVTLGPTDTEGAWVFSTRERADRWCEQFGNRFEITETSDGGDK